MASINDAITGGSTQSGGTAEQYYRWMLMKEKLSLQDGIPGRVKSGDPTSVQMILGTLSEEEKIRDIILKKVLLVKESTAEYDSMVALAGGITDRYRIADKIASAVWEKTLAKQKLSMFAPTKAELSDLYDTSEASAMHIRLGRGKPSDVASQKSAMSKLVTTMFGKPSSITFA